LDKAPDAFRTISEVAGTNLDIPQHVMRLWETRFTQLKPMTRAGAEATTAPDELDLLRGIRRRLYGEGTHPRRAAAPERESVASVQRPGGCKAVASCGSHEEVVGRASRRDHADAPASTSTTMSTMGTTASDFVCSKR